MAWASGWWVEGLMALSGFGVGVGLETLTLGEVSDVSDGEGRGEVLVWLAQGRRRPVSTPQIRSTSPTLCTCGVRVGLRGVSKSGTKGFEVVGRVAIHLVGSQVRVADKLLE